MKKIKSMTMPDGLAEFSDEGFALNTKMLFFYWLAAHQMNDATSPIWLTSHYQKYSETVEPFKDSLITVSDGAIYTADKLKLPPERIKEYFNQPSALVLQKDDLLLLLDEFLSISRD